MLRIMLNVLPGMIRVEGDLVEHLRGWRMHRADWFGNSALARRPAPAMPMISFDTPDALQASGHRQAVAEDPIIPISPRRPSGFPSIRNWTENAAGCRHFHGRKRVLLDTDRYLQAIDTGLPLESFTTTAPIFPEPWEVI